MSAELILTREIDGHLIGQRRADGYVNATALCKAAGKLWADYNRLSSTQEFLNELSRSMGIPIDQLATSLLTGPNEHRGTWVHPDVAVHLAQWCSARFAVQVSRWVRELLSTGRVELTPAQLESSGDALLDSFQVLQRTTVALVELRRHQLATDQEVVEVRGIAETAQATAVAALQTVGNHLGYLTVMGYCNITGRELSVREASGYGKQASAICRARGLRIEQTRSELYGQVNSYPESVLREVFQDGGGPVEPF